MPLIIIKDKFIELLKLFIEYFFIKNNKSVIFEIKAVVFSLIIQLMYIILIKIIQYFIIRNNCNCIIDF